MRLDFGRLWLTRKDFKSFCQAGEAVPNRHPFRAVDFGAKELELTVPESMDLARFVGMPWDDFC